MPRILAIGTCMLFVSATVLLGYAVRGRNPRTGGIFALASGPRTVPAALVVAGGLDDPMVMVLVGAVARLALQSGMARLLRARMAKMG